MISTLKIDTKFRNYYDSITREINFDIVNNQSDLIYGKLFSNRELNNVKRIINCGFLVIPATVNNRLSNVIAMSVNNYNDNAYIIPTINNTHFFFEVISTNVHVCTCKSYKNIYPTSDQIIFANPISIYSLSLRFYENTNRLIFPEDFLECAIDFDNVYENKTKLTVISGSSLVGGHGRNGHGMADDDSYYISFMNFRSNTNSYKSSDNSSDIIYKNNLFRVDYIDATSFYALGVVLPNNSSTRNVIIFIENHRISFNLILECEDEKKQIDLFSNSELTKVTTYQ